MSITLKTTYSTYLETRMEKITMATRHSLELRPRSDAVHDTSVTSSRPPPDLVRLAASQRNQERSSSPGSDRQHHTDLIASEQRSRTPTDILRRLQNEHQGSVQSSDGALQSGKPAGKTAENTSRDLSTLAGMPEQQQARNREESMITSDINPLDSVDPSISTGQPTEVPLPRLTDTRRLIIASNRGPVEHQLMQDKTLKAQRGAGGLVTALMDVGGTRDVTWVAMAMTEGDHIVANEARQKGEFLTSRLPGQHMQLRYVSVSKDVYHKYYDKTSNETLWFLQLGMYNPTQDAAAPGKLEHAWETGYVAANQKMADAINEEIAREKTPPIVMVQDYHLYLVPEMIRKQHPNVVTQQFIHIPWPDVRSWHFLPDKMSQAIYTGLASNDIIGFQTERDTHNFLEGARTIPDGAVVNFEDGAVWRQGHRTQARTYPISISVTEELKVVDSAAGRDAAESIKPLLNENTIMRVDRIEPVKNIIRGFQAYEEMLETHPTLHGRVTFLAFLVPSRQSLPMYQRLNADLRVAIDKINARYETDNWKPIQAFFGNDRVRALAAMQFYDVLLVNPISDGMNLVIKEGAVVNQKDGVAVLSRTAGAFQQLGHGSIPVSPTDVHETAEALYKALTLSPEERHTRANFVRTAVERSNLTVWLEKQMHDINDVLEGTPDNTTASESAGVAIIAGIR